MIEVIKTGFWFLQRPSFWGHAVALGWRKFKPAGNDQREQATRWAAAQAVPVTLALQTAGLLSAGAEDVPALPDAVREESTARAASASVQMGGPGDINLLYAATVLAGAERVVETGVAYGWSSMAILAALERIGAGSLASVDMPYPKMNNEAWVGVAVPDRLRNRWLLIRKPDRFGLKQAISHHGGAIDLCHYDSDKSYEGRMYGYGLLWDSLRPGGVFISDDIQDNLAFRDFIERAGAKYSITEYLGKYVGIARKP